MTNSEENYIKVIYHLSAISAQEISTNAIAAKMETKASSVSDMLKKLADKKLVVYQKYQGVQLTETGFFIAKMIIRKHRLWEVFLVEKLQFSWDEVHDLAEELEHIKSDILIDKLDAFLGFPEKDPHGDVIPNALGEIKKTDKRLLSEAEIGKNYICVGVKDSSSRFLKYLDKHNIALGTSIIVNEMEAFDNSFSVFLNNQTISISQKIATNLYIQ